MAFLSGKFVQKSYCIKERTLETLIKMKGIYKEFYGVSALSGVDLDLYPGEVHVILGENGAGKSTLMKVLNGLYSPTKGRIFVGEKEFSALSPWEAKSLGIATVYQELSVVNELTVAENMFIGNLPTKKLWKRVSVIDNQAMEIQAKGVLKKLGVNIDISASVRSLRVSEKQIVEVAKALLAKARVLILDEPTSSLTLGETNRLFDILRSLRKEGTGIVYISHKLDEIKKIGDRISILKDGHSMGTESVQALTKEEMVSRMVGRELNPRQRQSKNTGEPANSILFSARNITRKDRLIEDISFDLYEGEILGFAGLMGSGRTELVEALFGISGRMGGEMFYRGKALSHRSPSGGLKNGIAMITENRRETGFFQNFSIQENISIANEIMGSRWGGLWGLRNQKREKILAQEQREKLAIKCQSVNQNILELSGGNQQKVIIGKWLSCSPSLIIFDEPTRGIDVGAKSEIYDIIRELSEQGKGIIVVSSELPEIFSVCHRVLVFNGGRIVENFPIDQATEKKIMLAATKEENKQ